MLMHSVLFAASFRSEQHYLKVTAVNIRQNIQLKGISYRDLNLRTLLIVITIVAIYST